MNESSPETLPEYSPKYPSPRPIHGQISKNANARGIIRIIPTRATNLLPPKNATTAGSCTWWNLLYAHAMMNPTMIPPKIDVFKDEIPQNVPAIEYIFAEMPSDVSIPKNVACPVSLVNPIPASLSPTASINGD